MGKSELAEAFLSSVSPWSLTLQGRCYEAESVPFKACDGLVDELGALLRGMAAERRDAVLPRNMAMLEKVFPVLKELSPPRPEYDFPIDAHAMRDLALLALREMIGRLSDGRSVVIFIDDLHWGDIDSQLALAGMLSGSDSPCLAFHFFVEDGKPRRSIATMANEKFSNIPRRGGEHRTKPTQSG